ncbi:MAG: twin-arginine translocase TatA/TatE family subunit [Candidatus Geothermarchaeales archaeon]
MIILIVIVLVLLFGAKKLPELARAVGRATGEFQKGRKEMAREIERMGKEVDVKEIEAETDDQKLLKVAEDLGLDTKGKSIKEVKALILEKLSK